MGAHGTHYDIWAGIFPSNLVKKLGNAHGLNVLSCIWTRTDLHRVSVLPVFCQSVGHFSSVVGAEMC